MGGMNKQLILLLKNLYFISNMEVTLVNDPPNFMEFLNYSICTLHRYFLNVKYLYYY